MGYKNDKLAQDIVMLELVKPLIRAGRVLTTSELERKVREYNEDQKPLSVVPEFFELPTDRNSLHDLAMRAIYRGVQRSEISLRVFE